LRPVAAWAWRAVVAALAVSALAFPVPSRAEERVSIRAGALGPALRVDGRLDEPEWLSAPASAELVMVEPRQGDRPHGRATLQVLAGPRALVFGIRCNDPEPAAIVSFTKERDAEFEAEDHVVLVLDPFQDGRSGYVFAVNPGGARFDALVEAGGEDVNRDWDGEWEAATSRDATGWTAEIRIPIATLNFKRDLREWGLNVQRRVQRLQETSRWASPVLDYEVYQTSRAGLLIGLPEFDLGLGFGVRPSLVAGFGSHAPDAATEAVFEPSVDVIQRLGPNLTAALTVRTDFAETEVDTRETNLTRFPLFFPEKRTFFLQGADIFQFGTGLGEELVPFFTRRIGLVAGQEVPIRAGVKTTGRFGSTSVGALVVRTGKRVDLARAETLGAVRLQRNLFSESSAGMLATFGDPLGRPGSWQLGADFRYQTSRFRGNKNFIVGVWGLAMGRDDILNAGDRTAVGFKVDYPNDLWDCYVVYRRVGDAFDPSLGFVARPGVNHYQAGCVFAPRPKDSFIRQFFYEFYPTVVTDLAGRRQSYEIFTAPINWRLESGDRVEVNVVPVGERLLTPFEIADGVVVGPGSYDWRRYRLEFEAAAKRKLSGQASWWFGGFYGGTLHQVELEASWTPSPVITFLADVEHALGRLPQGPFDVTLVGTKVRLNLSPDLQVNSFLQYDTESRSFGTNTRLRWTFHPRGDVFLIYNHNLRELIDRWRRDSNELLVKVQYIWRR
jgi:hypothetical protein